VNAVVENECSKEEQMYAHSEKRQELFHRDNLAEMQSTIHVPIVSPYRLRPRRRRRRRRRRPNQGVQALDAAVGAARRPSRAEGSL